MAEETPHTATTEAPKQEGGFPPFDTTTFPSQFFWLAITFAFLFTVMWRVAGPRINGAITNRRGMINGAIAEAGRARADAEAAQAKLAERLNLSMHQASVVDLVRSGRPAPVPEERDALLHRLR